MSQDKNRDPIPANDIPNLLEFAVEKRLSELPIAVKIKHKREGDSFVDFGQLTNIAGNSWRLRELLTVKTKAADIDPEGEYAQPGLDSQNNTVGVKGNVRLGKNIKGKNKTIAEPGDLIIGTLHTNKGNGLFAIADRQYICTSQIVAKIRNEIVPPQYLIQALRKEFPRQLIPTDLVGRETFTPKQILDVVIPQPTIEDMNRLIRLEAEIMNFQSRLDAKTREIKLLLNRYARS